MKAKEYLMQLKKLNLTINQKLEEISALRSLLTNVSAVDNSEEKTSGGKANSDANFVNSIIKISELEKEADSEIDNFVEKKHKIINEIQGLNNSKYIDVLYRRYVKFESLEQIAFEMNYTYQYIIELHGYALNDFQTTYKIL